MIQMVKIEVKCEKGYDAKVFEKGDTLRYYLKGPSNMSNPRGEIGMIDLRGRFARNWLEWRNNTSRNLSLLSSLSETNLSSSTPLF